MTTIDDLLNDIFDSKRPTFYAEFEDWVRESRRFKAFAVSYRGKIRAKLKNAGDDEGRIQDLRAELETAAILLREERFTLEYETYAAAKTRGPDFTVTFRTHTPFNVEVRRIRSSELADIEAKLITVLVDKVGQMPPSIVNLLWLNAEREISEVDVTHAAALLRQRTERKEEDFFTRRGYANAADFLKHYGQLSGIVWRQGDGYRIWLNALARHKVPPEIVTAIQRLALP